MKFYFSNLIRSTRPLKIGNLYQKARKLSNFQHVNLRLKVQNLDKQLCFMPLGQWIGQIL